MKKKLFVLLLIIFLLNLFSIGCVIQDNPTPKLLFIAVSEQPGKTTYLVGEKLNLEGLNVNGYFSDGNVITIGDYITEPENDTILETKGKKIVKIIKDEINCEFEIDVKEPEQEKIDLEEKEQAPQEEAPQDEAPQEEIQKCSLQFCKQPEDYQCELYETLILDCSVNAKGIGLVSFDWYRKNSNETDFKKIVEGEKQALDSENPMRNTLDITNSPYLNSQYYCEVSLKNETEEIKIKSDIGTVNKRLPYTGLPTVIIETKDGEDILSRTEYKKTSIEIKSNNSSFGDFGKDEIGEASIKGRGNSSWSIYKNSYTLKLKKKRTILDLPESKKWVLIANFYDPTLLRNDFASNLGNSVFTNMEWNPHFQSVDLVKNGKYFGTYLMGEQIKIAAERVNIQSIADTINGEKGEDLNNDGVVDIQDGGFLIEIDGRKDANWYYTTTHHQHCCLKDPDTDDFEGEPTVLPLEAENYIKKIIQTAEDSLYADNFTDIDNGYAKYFDVDSFIDWYLINEFTMHDDAAAYYTSCYFYYNPKDQKIHMGPNWDFDVAMGNYSGVNLNTETYFARNYGWTNRMFQDPAFVTATKNRWNEIKITLKNAIDVTYVQKYYDISLSASLNVKVWGVNWPVGFYAPIMGTYNGYIRYLKEWLEKRYAWLDEQIQNW